MKRTILLAVFSTALANAGILKVATYPVRHPVKTVKCAAIVAFFPVLHHVRTARALGKVLF
jgi:hypothetical protein